MKFTATNSYRSLPFFKLITFLLGPVFLIIFVAATALSATFMVNNLNDSGPGSLRQAIIDANTNRLPDLILFDPILFSSPQTIVLTTGMLSIEKGNEWGSPSMLLEIEGPGAGLLTISGGGTSRIFGIKQEGMAIISNLTISNGNGNSMPGEMYGTGGGILVEPGYLGEEVYSLVLKNSVVSNNVSSSSGGGINISGRTYILNCSIFENIATSGGGGISIRGSLLRVVNTTISSNSTSTYSGGGILNNNADVHLTNSTVAFNSAPSEQQVGGGLYGTPNYQSYITRFFLRNTIVAKNTSGLGNTPQDVFRRFISQGYNIIGTSTGVSEITGDTTGDQMDVDPELDPTLAANGSPLLTHALFADSSAIDAGDNCVLVSSGNGGCIDTPIPFDQRGQLRPQDGNGDGSSVVDVGAFEIEEALLASPDRADLLPISDTGVSESDNITNATELSFTVGGILSGSTVEIFRNEDLLQTVNPTENSISFGDVPPALDGVYRYRVRQRIGKLVSPFSNLAVTIDRTGPGISIQQALTQSDPTRTQPIHFVATLNEAEYDLDQSDLSFAGSTANTAEAQVTLGEERPEFDIQISGLTSGGTVVVSFPANSFHDIAGNPNVPSSGPDNSVTLNTAPPTEQETLRQDPFFSSGRGFNDDVLDMALQPDGKMIIVGKFTNGTGTTWSGVMRMLPNGNIDESFHPVKGPNNRVNAVAILPDGKILIGGNFNRFDDIVVGGIVRLLPDGTLDRSFDPGTGANGGGASEGLVNTIKVLPDGKLLVGGAFTQFNGANVRRIARLQSNGNLDLSFIGTSVLTNYGQVVAITVQSDGNILVGGGDNFGGGYLIRLQPNGARDSSFSSGSALGVQEIVQTSSGILVGSLSGLTRIRTNGSTDPTFSATGVYSVTDMAVQPDGKILLSGDFYREGGLTWTATRLNADGSNDTSFTRTETRDVYAIERLPNGSVIIAGSMYQSNTAVGGFVNVGVRRLNPDGTRDDSYLTRTSFSANGTPQKIMPRPNGEIFVSGGFTILGGRDVSGAARLDSSGALIDSFVPAVTTFSAAGIQPDGKVIVGGDRSGYMGTYGIYRLTESGSIDPSFTAQSYSSNDDYSTVDDIQVQPDGKVIVVGGFQKVNGQPKSGIVRLLPNGSIDPEFNLDLHGNRGYFYKLRLMNDGSMIVAGSVRQGTSTPNHTLMKLSSSGSAIWATQLSTDRSGILVSGLDVRKDGSVVITGSVSRVNGGQVKDIALIRPDGTPDFGFRPPTFIGLNNDPGYVSAVIALRNGKFLVGGSFFVVNGIDVQFPLVILNEDGSFSADSSKSLAGQGSVTTLARQADGKIVVSGGFSGLNGIQRMNMSRLLPLDNSAFLDFDGDGKTDLSVFRRSAAQWWYNRSSDGGNGAVQFAASNDVLVPGDFTGDGKADVAAWRPADGIWYILRSEDLAFYAFPFGANGDIPAPADYDGDGRIDAAVFRPSTSTWYILRSSGGTSIFNFGIDGDKPVPADYDGDGKADIAIFRPNGNSGGGEWWYLRSSDGQNRAFAFGAPADKAVPGDYTGDGRADLALWRPSNGSWFILRSEDSSFYSFPFGTTGDRPVAGDFDGDGRSDAAIFRPSNSTWYVNGSTAGVLIQQFGASGDDPLPGAFVR